MEWLCCVCSQTRLGPGPRQQGRQVQEVGFPTRNKMEGGRRPVCTSEARKIGVPLARARDGRPLSRFGHLAGARSVGGAFRSALRAETGPQRQREVFSPRLLCTRRRASPRISMTSAVLDSLPSCCTQLSARSSTSVCRQSQQPKRLTLMEKFWPLLLFLLLHISTVRQHRLLDY